jgi:16S rRNA (guanine527-N7)-methyltransferase
VSPEEFAALFDVPRGTIDRLIRYEALLKAWQERMNLVAPSTLSDIWGRHFADSAQLAKIIEPGRFWLDFGAGAGFPGLVLAAMDWGRFVLVESIAKKCRFLEEVADALGISPIVSVGCARVEALSPLRAEVVTARATSALPNLFDWSLRHGRDGTRFVFPKGRSWAEEVEAARARFQFEMQVIESMTDPEARILLFTGLKRKAR